MRDIEIIEESPDRDLKKLVRVIGLAKRYAAENNVRIAVVRKRAMLHRFEYRMSEVWGWVYDTQRLSTYQLRNSSYEFVTAINPDGTTVGVSTPRTEDTGQ